MLITFQSHCMLLLKLPITLVTGVLLDSFLQRHHVTCSNARNQMYHTSRPFEVSTSSTTMVRITLANLMQGVMKAYILVICLLVKHFRVYNKWNKVIEKSIHVVFDKTNSDFAHISSFDEFHLIKYIDGEDEEAQDKCNHQNTHINVN